MCEVFTADTILKQTEEDCRYLCTGDGILWLYFAIPVTNNVSKVVSVVQTQCVIIRNFYCRLGLAAATAAGGILRPDCIQVVRLNVVNNNLIIRLERSALAVSLRIPAAECITAACEGIFTP